MLNNHLMKRKVIIVVMSCIPQLVFGQISIKTETRARDLGILFDGITGRTNSISDVRGVFVGHSTKIVGEGKLVFGKGPIRTGVTVILPTGFKPSSVPSGCFTINGDGEVTGLEYIRNYGTLYGAIGLTNTNSVGIVRDALGAWNLQNSFSHDNSDFAFGLPVVGETWDGLLNDINGFHINKKDVFNAIENADTIVKEGNIGGGTGMRSFGFKSGIGTSSRIITIDSIKYTIGVLVQTNFGKRQDLIVSGINIGKELIDSLPIINETKEKDGSIIVVIATDIPLLPKQLELISFRATHGIARCGGISANSSGDFSVAFSTAKPEKKGSFEFWKSVSKEKLDDAFKATIQATEEAIVNSLIAAKTMSGINGNTFFAIPHAKLKTILKKHNLIHGK